ncbi:TIM-barrel domain-containing protein, partial [Candidatus Hakubella thermalkaliphila]
EVKENERQVKNKTSRRVVKITKGPWEFLIYNSMGHLVCGESHSDLDVQQKLKIKTLSYYKDETGIERVVGSFRVAPDERFYGFGEKFTTLDKRGQKIIAWNVDALGVGTEKSYKNVPFFMSTRGYGVFINSCGRVTYHMGDLSNVSYTIEVEDRKLDYYLLYGPSFKEILGQYTEITGKAPVPPKWSFGLWMSRFYYRSRDMVETVCDNLRRCDIPCDVINPDVYWMRDRMLCDFTWDETRFPSPEDMLSRMEEKGFKLCLWEHPYVSVASEMFKEGEDKGYFATKEDGSVYEIYSGLPAAMSPEEEFMDLSKDLPSAPPNGIVDFSNPEAVNWYKDKHHPLLRMGVKVFKTDFGEEIPEDAHFYNGMRGKEMHNLYPLLYNRAVFEVTEEVTGRGLVWSRSAWAGSQKYPVHWGGDPQTDFPSLACTLRGGLSLGLSGIPFWSHDIGGFAGPRPSPKLYIRWAQFGLLSSHARCHGITPREPWEYGEEALSIFRFYAKLRYRLIPYLYSYAHVASKTGLPLMRAMVLEYQDDPNTYDKDLQYMLGQELLVAPIFDESDKRYLYLPPGRWIDYWNGNEYEGPGTIYYEAPIDKIPLFVKAGAIIPMGPEMSYVGEKPFDPITLDIYPHGLSEFTLYDDDETTTFRCQGSQRELMFEITTSPRTYLLKFNKISCPTMVEINGERIASCSSYSALESSQQGWWWDPSAQLYVKTKAEGGARIRVL